VYNFKGHSSNDNLSQGPRSLRLLTCWDCGFKSH